ncbi:MAG: glycosyltransferase [Candidatus Omnitrophica bacterium]|nr:glycosyltransferase [Candidatus Omnitrophota bacterium]
MSKELVSVVVVSAKDSDYLKACLDSIKGQDYPRVEVFLIDTSDAHDLGQGLAGDYPFMTLCHSSGASYCQALNMGIEISRGKFILCLNDDVILDKSFIQEALKGFAVSKNIGMVSAKVLRFDKRTIDSAGLRLSIWCTAKERGYGRQDKGQFEKQGFVFGVGGAVAFYRREMLERIKLEGEYFDNDFGFFYEDLDVAWRAERHRFRGYYIPTAVAYHLRGLTTRKGRGIDKPFARRFLDDELHAGLIKNRYLTVIKNERLFNFILHLPFIFLYDCVSWGYIFLCKRAVIGYFLRNSGCFKRAFRKRKEKQGSFLYS